MAVEYFKTIFVLFRKGKIKEKDDIEMEDLDKLETM